MVILPDGLFEFQDETVNYLLNTTMNKSSKQTIVVKAPTGSGKTVMLIAFIDEYLKNAPNTAFVWLCPGKGDLEEQSKKQMDKICPTRTTKNLFDSINQGFESGTTTFINWELVTKKGNTALRDSERKNLFERINDAKRNGISFIVIIDEEHSNNTSKAAVIIDSFVAEHIIRVSATTTKNKEYEFYEVDEEKVIDAGLITQAISVNEGITNDSEADDDILLEFADIKRKEIDKAYKDLNKDIRPLVLIQFPNGQPKRVQAVEEKLAEMGYTYNNGMVAKWLSEDKEQLTDDITTNSGTPVFLLMKQAINVGWDCPRAKILVKLREGGSETFQIQTVGRIRRMPERKHYEITTLDLCYVYTYDEKYKEGLLAGIDKAYVPKRVTLKEKCLTFTLEKELRNLDIEGISERELFSKVRKFYIDKYNLTEDKNKNTQKLAEKGDYRFDKEMLGKTLTGTFALTESLVNDNENNFITTRTEIDTHKHGIYFLHNIDELKVILGVKTNVVKVIMERLFRNKHNNKHKLLALDTKEFYAFIINNADNFRRDFRFIAAEVTDEQEKIPQLAKKTDFTIPEEDFLRYDSSVKDEIQYLSGAYNEYTSGFATSIIRSQPEMLFEQYCEEHRDKIDWVYKNGDTGQQYFSIVYMTASFKQRLFYPDYIVKMNDGTVWVLETKGGESKGADKNIDLQAKNKFKALKAYAEDKKLNWGFIRDKDNQLYFCNTEYTDKLDDNWINLKTVLI